MPQQNREVERRFLTLKTTASAMMKDANLTKEAKSKLWGKAAMMAIVMENITLNPKHEKTPFEIFTAKKSKLYSKLVEFGRVGYVKNLGIHKNWEPKAVKCVMVGYASNHMEDIYQFYKETRKVVLSRDVKWAEWEKLKPTHGISIFEKKPELLKEECCVKKVEEYEIFDLDEENYEKQLNPPVQNAVKAAPQQPVQNAVKAAPQQPVQNSVKAAPQQPVPTETRAMKQEKLKKEAEEKAEDKARKLARQMAALNTFNKRVTRSKSQVNAVEEGYNGEEEIQTVNFMDTTAAKPKSFKEAVNGPEKVEWMESMISEVINFLTRKSWKMVNKLVPPLRNEENDCKIKMGIQKENRARQFIDVQVKICFKGEHSKTWSGLSRIFFTSGNCIINKEGDRNCSVLSRR